MKIQLVSLLAVLTASLIFGCTDSGPADPVDGPFGFAAQTHVDEAFENVVSPNNVYDPTVDWESKMPEGFQGKRNASYPWGTTTYGNDELWMGTISNGWCAWPFQNLEWPLELTTYESTFTGCSIPNVISTPSEVYIYNFEAGTQELIYEGSLTSGGPEYTAAKQRHEGMPELQALYGLRAAGTSGSLVFFAGHHMHTGNDGWLRLYVFNAKTRAFLGYRELRGDTTRRFETITDENGDTAFYTIIGAETGMTQNGEGPTVMLRWVGTEDEPFKGGNYTQTDTGEGAGWDVVSEGLDGVHGMVGDFKQFTHVDGSERLIMSSAAHPLLYRTDTGEPDPARSESVMLLSEPVPAGGWTRDNLMNFEVVFGMDRYDPDTKGRWGAKWGTTNIHNGYIYFGTYHQGTGAAYKHFREADADLFGELTATRAKHEEFIINEWRASSIFRMKLEDIGPIATGEKDPELLYGYENFRVANDSGEWVDTENKLGQQPKFGEAGLGHPGNVYSWTSLSKDGQLFWGFFDAFSGTHDLLFEADASQFLFTSGPPMPVADWEQRRDESLTRALYDWAEAELNDKGLGDEFVPGGDLVVFEGEEEPRILTTKGFGNPCANGIRNVEVLNDRIFFATSTWCNLSDRAGLEFYEYLPKLDD